MSEGEADLLKTLAVAAIAFVLIVPGIIWQAYVGNVLWGWFVTPTTGIVAPGIATIFGIFLLARMALFNRSKIEDDSDKPGWQRVAVNLGIAFFGPAFSLLAGWIAVQFV